MENPQKQKQTISIVVSDESVLDYLDFVEISENGELELNEENINILLSIYEVNQDQIIGLGISDFFENIIFINELLETGNLDSIILN